MNHILQKTIALIFIAVIEFSVALISFMIIQYAIDNSLINTHVSAPLYIGLVLALVFTYMNCFINIT